MASTWLTGGLLLAILPQVFGDGIGMIGYGKTMYQPPCAFACRSVIAGCPLTCTPPPTDDGEHGMTPPECYAGDQSFLRTMAYCIDKYCPGNGNPPLSVIEDYWAGHLATGSTASYEYKLAATYQEALEAAKKDEHANGSNTTSSSNEHHGHKRLVLVVRHGAGPMEDTEPDTTNHNTSLPIIKSGMPLNATSFIREKDWQKNYNGLSAFEINETGHTVFQSCHTVGSTRISICRFAIAADALVM